MRILVTGNMGYVGPSVIEHLRATRASASLVGLDTGYFAHRLTNSRRLPETLVDVQVFADVRQTPELALAGADGVVHLAAISNDPMGHAFSEVTLEVNHRASVELARRAKAAGARSFIYASSCSVYGAAEEPRGEGSPLNPLTAYARSKILAEQDLARLADGGFQVTCLRYATACGMSERLRLDLVLNDFVAAAIASGTIQVLSDGTPWRPLIHVRDMARAADWALDRRDGGDFLAVNVGSDRWNYRIKDLAEAVARAIPGVTVTINAEAPPDRRSYAVDFGLYRTLAPDHQPRVELEEAVRELAAGLTAMGFKDRDFRSSGWMRLRALTELRDEGLIDERLAWMTAARPAATA